MYIAPNQQMNQGYIMLRSPREAIIYLCLLLSVQLHSDSSSLVGYVMLCSFFSECLYV